MSFSLKNTTLVSLFSAVVASSVSFSTFALQTNEPTIRIDEALNKASIIKTSSVKAKLMNKLATIKHFTADFNQQVLDSDGNELQNASGTLAVQKPNLVHWNTAEPDESLIVSDGKTLWYYNPFIEQVSAYLLEKAIMNTPILLLTSNDPELWQHYSVSSMNEDNYLIHANDNNSQVKTLELRFKDSGLKNELESFTILDATGQLSIFKLAQLDQNNVPQNSLFEFTTPDGVELDDQR